MRGFRLYNLYLKTPRGLGASSPHVLSYVKKFNEQCKKIKWGDRCLPRNNYICIAMYKQIISEQRYTINVLLQKKMSKKDIAKAINVDLSTIYRELKRNSGSHNHYNWETAEANARRKKRRTPGNRRISQEVREEALRLLKEKQWSPEQISGYLAKEGKRISTESIYRIIRKDKKEGGSLYKNCRHRLKHRARPVGGKRIVIPNRVSISERPKEVDGVRFGDFEMDTIVGKG